MSEGSAKVELDTLKHFRRGLQLFCESVNAALGDGESDLRRTLLWLEGEAQLYWQNEIRKREKVVQRCKEAVRMKTIFRDATGGKQSAVDEEKALKIAQQKMAVALEKSANVTKYLQRLQKDALLFKGHVQRLATNVQSDLPTANHKLGALLATLELYTAAAPSEAGSTAPAAATSDSMARPEQLDTPAPVEPKSPTEERSDGNV